MKLLNVLDLRVHRDTSLRVFPAKKSQILLIRQQKVRRDESVTPEPLQRQHLESSQLVLRSVHTRCRRFEESFEFLLVPDIFRYSSQGI